MGTKVTRFSSFFPLTHLVILLDVFGFFGLSRVIRQMGRWVVRLLLRSGLIRSIFALEFS